jgi:hypothetical protein
LKTIGSDRHERLLVVKRSLSMILPITARLEGPLKLEGDSRQLMCHQDIV